jgi:hypothetical protein
MGERVSSDDPSIQTFRASIERDGATRRSRLALPPAAAAVVPTDVVRFVLDGATYHADVRPGSAGPVVHGAYDNPRLARSPGAGENRLTGWLEDVGLGVGRSAQLDVVVPDVLYGLRAPGTTTVYEVVDPPAASLSDIAASLDE